MSARIYLLVFLQSIQGLSNIVTWNISFISVNNDKHDNVNDFPIWEDM